MNVSVRFRNRKAARALLERAIADDAAASIDITPTLGPKFSSTYAVAARFGHLVALQGEIVAASGVAADDVVFDLPLGFDPEAAIKLCIRKVDGSALAVIAVAPNTGIATWVSGSAGTYTLSGLTLVDPWKNG